MSNTRYIRFCLFLGCSFFPGVYCHVKAQDSFEEFKRSAQEQFEKFKLHTEQEFEAYRRSINEEFAKYMEQDWQNFRVSPKDIIPEVPSPKPVIEDIDTVKHRTPVPIIISEVAPVTPPLPQPEPIEPIREIIEDKGSDYLIVRFYGTDLRVRKPDLSRFSFSTGSGKDFANGWKWLNNDRTNNLIKDCLDIRGKYALCDWAYLSLLRNVSEILVGKDSNAAILLTGFLFNQSGYKMRFGIDGQKKLHLFYNPTGIVYNTPLLLIDGERFYDFADVKSQNNSFEICNFSFPGEKSLSFEILKPMKLNYDAAESRKVTAHYHSEVSVEVAVNRNLIDFYNDYPTATINNIPETRWAVYANTPVSAEIQQSIYPVLREKIRGKSQKEAADILLHLAQSFKYGYDDEVWGGDRAFFMDESWYYPLSDCEDHAINFTRLIRDLMGLDAALVYYPGHLAAAVAFTDPEVTGDYLIYDGVKYIVCDPTIFYSNVGTTMRGMNNSEAVLVPLRLDKDIF